MYLLTAYSGKQIHQNQIWCSVLSVIRVQDNVLAATPWVKYCKISLQCCYFLSTATPVQRELASSATSPSSVIRLDSSGKEAMESMTCSGTKWKWWVRIPLPPNMIYIDLNVAVLIFWIGMVQAPLIQQASVGLSWLRVGILRIMLRWSVIESHFLLDRKRNNIFCSLMFVLKLNHYKIFQENQLTTDNAKFW